MSYKVMSFVFGLISVASLTFSYVIYSGGFSGGSNIDKLEQENKHLRTRIADAETSLFASSVLIRVSENDNKKLMLENARCYGAISDYEYQSQSMQREMNDNLRDIGIQLMMQNNR